MRIFVASLGTAALVGGATWVAVPRGPAPVAPLALALAARGRGPVPAPNEVWVFFRVADCHMTSAPFDSLNAISMRSRVRVTGVMLDPPSDSAAAARAVRAFHAKFPVLLDRDSTYARTLRGNGLGNPLYALMRDGKLVAILSPAAFGSASLVLQALAE